MTDAELRATLLSHFYDLRHANGGFVPVNDMILNGGEHVTLEAIGGVCRQLRDAGLIEWTGYVGQGPIIGRARITGPGVDAVDRGKAALLGGGYEIIGGTPAGLDLAWPRAQPKENQMFSRQLVIAASDILKAPGHTGFDRMLVEFDLLDEIVGREVSLKDRATSLAKYAIQHPEIKTAEGGTIANAIVSRAVQIVRDTGAMSSNVSDLERNKFATLAAREGISLEFERLAQEPITIVPAEGFRRMNDRTTDPKTINKVFVVHGRDEGTKNEVALFLRHISLEPIILHQRPHKGRHILTKFKEEAEGVSFAVVLMTPDDQGGLIGEAFQKRARQNVVFELGFFIGVLGTERVVALIKTDVEKPSDFDGIGYILFDVAGTWKTLLAREMREVGVPFDSDALLTA